MHVYSIGMCKLYVNLCDMQNKYVIICIHFSKTVSDICSKFQIDQT